MKSGSPQCSSTRRSSSGGQRNFFVFCERVVIGRQFFASLDLAVRCIVTFNIGLLPVCFESCGTHPF